MLVWTCSRLDVGSGCGDVSALTVGEEEASEEANEWAAIGLLGAGGGTTMVVCLVFARSKAADLCRVGDLIFCGSGFGDWKGWPGNGVEAMPFNCEGVTVLDGFFSEGCTAGGDRGS